MFLKKVFLAAVVAAALVAGSFAPVASGYSDTPHTDSAISNKRGPKKPAKKPTGDASGATAECRDGTYSYSAHRRGTCSHHGGVKRWLR
jgi:hypothetical protein